MQGNVIFDCDLNRSMAQEDHSSLLHSLTLPSTILQSDRSLHEENSVRKQLSERWQSRLFIFIAKKQTDGWMNLPCMYSSLSLDAFFSDPLHTNSDRSEFESVWFWNRHMPRMFLCWMIDIQSTLYLIETWMSRDWHNTKNKESRVSNDDHWEMKKTLKRKSNLIWKFSLSFLCQSTGNTSMHVVIDRVTVSCQSFGSRSHHISTSINRETISWTHTR